MIDRDRSRIAADGLSRAIIRGKRLADGSIELAREQEAAERRRAQEVRQVVVAFIVLALALLAMFAMFLADGPPPLESRSIDFASGGGSR